MNKDDLIIELIKEVREEVRDQRRDISDIKETNYANHLNWVEHTRRTAALEKIVDNQGVRIESLEEPVKVKEAVKNKTLKIVSGVSVLIGLVAAIIKLF